MPSDFAQRVAQLKPELATHMQGYLAEKDPAAARFFAVFLMLRAPGLEPVVRPAKFRIRTLRLRAEEALAAAGHNGDAGAEVVDVTVDARLGVEAHVELVAPLGARGGRPSQWRGRGCGRS